MARRIRGRSDGPRRRGRTGDGHWLGRAPPRPIPGATCRRAVKAFTWIPIDLPAPLSGACLPQQLLIMLPIHRGRDVAHDPARLRPIGRRPPSKDGQRGAGQLLPDDVAMRAAANSGLEPTGSPVSDRVTLPTSSHRLQDLSATAGSRSASDHLVAASLADRPVISIRRRSPDCVQSCGRPEQPIPTLRGTAGGSSAKVRLVRQGRRLGVVQRIIGNLQQCPALTGHLGRAPNPLCRDCRPLRPGDSTQHASRLIAGSTVDRADPSHRQGTGGRPRRNVQAPTRPDLESDPHQTDEPDHGGPPSLTDQDRPQSQRLGAPPKQGRPSNSIRSRAPPLSSPVAAPRHDLEFDQRRTIVPRDRTANHGPGGIGSDPRRCDRRVSFMIRRRTLGVLGPNTHRWTCGNGPSLTRTAADTRSVAGDPMPCAPAQSDSADRGCSAPDSRETCPARLALRGES
jgi:hypothetical protein